MTLYRNVDARAAVQSEARRNHVHGPLQGLIDSRSPGEPHPMAGGAILVGLFVIFTILVALWS